MREKEAGRIRKRRDRRDGMGGRKWKWSREGIRREENE